MKVFRPLPIAEQTIVITGASSGVGLATAKLAAQLGAKVVLCSRNGDELQRSLESITREGGSAIAVLADVSKQEDLFRLRDEALRIYGKIDTWINNAAVSLHGYLLDTSLDEERQLFDINFWGARMGSAMAVQCLSKRGGTLINIGSEVSIAAQPLLGIYMASKHALKAFTESLRSELKDMKVQVKVCMVYPTSMDTPSSENAAKAILKCAFRPKRDVYVGGPARLTAVLDTFFPHIKDIMAETKLKELRKARKRKYPYEKKGLTKEAS